MPERESNWSGPLKSAEISLVSWTNLSVAAGGQHDRVAPPDSSGVMLRHPNPNPAIGLERDSSMMNEAENYIALAYCPIR